MDKEITQLMEDILKQDKINKQKQKQIDNLEANEAKAKHNDTAHQRVTRPKPAQIPAELTA